MKKIAVIGLGNTLRRDDGIGIVILESLLSCSKREGMDYLNFGTASFDLLYRLEHYDTVVLIDGIDAALAPGELKIFGLDKIEHISPGEPISTHEVNLKGLFELCQKLRVKTKIFVAGIQVKDISYGEGLSEELRQRTQETIQEISKFLDQVCGER